MVLRRLTTLSFSSTDLAEISSLEAWFGLTLASGQKIYSPRNIPWDYVLVWVHRDCPHLSLSLSLSHHHLYQNGVFMHKPAHTCMIKRIISTFATYAILIHRKTHIHTVASDAYYFFSRPSFSDVSPINLFKSTSRNSFLPHGEGLGNYQGR